MTIDKRKMSKGNIDKEISNMVIFNHNPANEKKKKKINHELKDKVQSKM